MFNFLKNKVNNTEEHNIDFDAKLKKAVIKSNGYEIKYCIENGANPNIIHNGGTLLFYMVFSNSPEMVELCLKHGAIATMTNLKHIDDSEIEGKFNRDAFEFYKNKTPIDLAIEKDYTEVLHIFLKYNIADSTLKNWVDKKLFLSIIDNDIKNIEYYLQHGADIYYTVPISFMSKFNELDSDWEKLIKYRMKSTFDLAIQSNNIEVLKLFMKYNLGDKKLQKWFLESDVIDSELVDLIINYEDLTNKNEKSTKQSENIKLDELEKKFESKYNIQNKFIRSISDEIERLSAEIPNGAKDKQIEELKLQAQAFQNTLTSQSDKIIELQNKLIKKEQDTKDLVDSLVSKIESHENKYDTQNKFIKSISSEIEHLKAEVKNSLKNNQIEELALQVKVFQKLEEKIDKQKVVTTKAPINIPTEKQSIKKDDGVIVKRDSFDDF